MALTVIQLRDELNKYIEQGNGNAQIVFDTEAGAFDYHFADLNNTTILFKKEESGEKSDLIILSSSDPKFHNWVVLSEDEEDESEVVKPTNYNLGENHECKMLSQGDDKCVICGKQMF